MAEKPLKIEEKLDLIKFNTDRNYAHISVNMEICKEKCTTFECVYGCPSECYRINNQGKENDPIVFDYIACIECGTCRIVCPHNSIRWTYPKGGFGVEYKNS